MNIKRLSVVLGVVALSAALLLGQTGSGQMGQPMGPMAQTQNPEQLQMEIHLLKAINQAGFTQTQLEQLQAIISDLQAARQTSVQHQQELKDFLLDWQGNPEEFDEALRSFQEQAQQAQQNAQQQRQAAVERLKNVLTYRQGEVLLDVLGPRPDRGPQMGMYGMGMAMMAPAQPPQMGQMMDQMQQHMRAMMEQMRQHMGPSRQGMGMMGQMQPHHQQMMERMKSMMSQMGRMRGMMGQRDPGPMVGQRPDFGALFLQHLDVWDKVITEKLAHLKGEM